MGNISPVKKSIPKSQSGAMVKKWRDHLGISREELAKRAGLGQECLSEIEAGARNLSLECISKLATVLETSPAIHFPRQSKKTSSRPGKLPPPDPLADILLVEDDADDAELTMQALKKSGVTNRVHVVRDGVEALDFLFGAGKYAERRTAKLPHLILLDLHLPKLDGLEVLRQLKANSRTSSIPVVILAGSKEECDICASQASGAEAYLVKSAGFGYLNEVAPQLHLKWALIKPRPSAGL